MAKTSTKSVSKASSPLATKNKSIKKTNGKTLKLKASPKASNVIIKTIPVYKDQKDFFKMNDGIMKM